MPTKHYLPTFEIAAGHRCNTRIRMSDAEPIKPAREPKSKFNPLYEGIKVVSLSPSYVCKRCKATLHVPKSCVKSFYEEGIGFGGATYVPYIVFRCPNCGSKEKSPAFDVEELLAD